jgi:hypothetical protein
VIDDPIPDNDHVECRDVHGALDHACGAISCGWECICGDPEKSACACVYGMTGPLSPPDFPEDLGLGAHPRAAREVRRRDDDGERSEDCDGDLRAA